MSTRTKFVGQPKPVPFNVDDTADVYRLLSECWGYLKTCHNKHGTDWEGRQFAMDALDELQKRDWKLVPDPAQS
jgi:hypothetical protein